MNGNIWLWIALVGFLAFCFLSLLFMGGQRRHRQDEVREEERIADK